MSAAKFPLEPLRTVRGIRLRALEGELKRCRECLVQAEQVRAAAEQCLEQATAARQDFADRGWTGMFGGGTPTALAIERYERHLALLDQQLAQHRIELDARSRDCADAQTALDQALATWRQARGKLDAVDEMKQGWLREARSRAELIEEQNLEELSLRRAPTP
jgi:flagellar biosynthesis chaperone FliJ